jgi:hypothetical protein
MVRYFKKYNPKITVSTGAGYSIPFEQVLDDNGQMYEWGVLATQDGYVIGELENLMGRQAGGVMEIGQAEFESLKKKEHQKLLPGWRETVWPRQLHRLLPDLAREIAADVKRAMPAVVRGLQSEIKILSRPVGTITGWQPKSVVR